MELEQILPETTQQINAKALLRVCRRFANVLTEKAWNQDDMLNTKTSHSIKSMRAIPPYVDANDTLVEEKREVTISVNFEANKEQSDFNDETQRPEFDEEYTVSASIREVVAPGELPEWILEQAMQKLNLIDEEGRKSSLGEANVGVGVLSNFKFEKESEIEYVIDEYGELNDYAVVCRYWCDDWLLDQAQYSWEAIEGSYEATVVEGEATEFRKKIDAPLTEGAIEEFQRSFDTLIEAFIDDVDNEEAFNQLEQNETESGISTTEEAHNRRVLGMIALNSRRFVGMNIK